MLYGDWGTSRFYVLGLAFFYAGHASLYYVAGVCALVAAVGWAYTVVCRCFPDGGGVYSAAKQIHPVVAVVGALLLFSDYVVTASLSALDAMHYVGVPDRFVPAVAMACIALVGAINFVGTRRAGTFALWVALATLALTLLLVAFTVPWLGEGWSRVHRPTESLGHQWLMLVNVVLALSGVEAVANMTGVMRQPVATTSRRAIWPVLVEVVVFNLVLAVGMNALPAVLGDGIADHNDEVKNAVLRVMAEHYVGEWFAWMCGLVFGLLLLSAVNTVVADMISIQYVMGRDKELPAFLTRLNTFGVPGIALVPAIGLPILVLCFVTDLAHLADLYAIGVVGAIAVNLSCCTMNRELALKRRERVCIGAIALVLIALWVTLAIEKTHALMFVGSIVGVGLVLRLAARRIAAARAAKPATPAEGVNGLAALGTPAMQLDPAKPRVLVATRGGERLIDFAAGYAKQMGAILFVLYVRQLNVATPAASPPPTIDEDREARRVFERALQACRKIGVPMVPIYVVGPDVAEPILDFAATYNAAALLLGVSREGSILRTLRGDVVGRVADHLPEEIPLLVHA